MLREGKSFASVLVTIFESTLAPYSAAIARHLRSAGIAFRRLDNPDGVPMHNKFVLADEGRRRWVGQCVRQALGSLPAGPWTLRHAAGWPAIEQQAVREELTRALGVEPQLRSDSIIEAGLVIDSGGACLDGSLRGLLADRHRLEARLLALLAGESRP